MKETFKMDCGLLNEATLDEAIVEGSRRTC